MVHQIQIAVLILGIAGLVRQMARDVRAAWPQIVQLVQSPNDAMLIVRYAVIAHPVAHVAAYDPHPIEDLQLAA